MSFRKIALALFACLALGAFAANAAQAAQWTVGTTENQTSAGSTLASESVSCKRHGTSPLIFTSTLLGLEVELEAAGVDCLKKKIEEPKTEKEEPAIINTVGGVAHSEGVLTFTTVQVLKPSKKCSVNNTGGVVGEITTEPLTDEVIMDPTAGSTVVFDKFFPEAPATAFVTLEFSGVECPLQGSSAPVKGTACGEAAHTNAAGTGFEPNKTGTLTKVQTLNFNGATTQSTGGCALTLGTKAAQLTGAVDNELAGVNAGKPFGAD